MMILKSVSRSRLDSNVADNTTWFCFYHIDFHFAMFTMVMNFCVSHVVCMIRNCSQSNSRHSISIEYDHM